MMVITLNYDTLYTFNIDYSDSRFTVAHVSKGTGDTYFLALRARRVDLPQDPEGRL